MCYNAKSKDSFNEIEKFHEQVRDHANQDTNVILVGTHCDGDSIREVSLREVESYSLKHNVPFIEVNKNVFLKGTF